MKPELLKAEPLSLASYGILADVEIGVLAELDRRTISFRDLLQLDVDGVLVLTRPVGENIDLYIDRVLVGNGEILVVDDSLAIRVADLRDKPSNAKVLEIAARDDQAA